VCTLPAHHSIIEEGLAFPIVASLMAHTFLDQLKLRLGSPLDSCLLESRTLFICLSSGPNVFFRTDPPRNDPREILSSFRQAWVVFLPQAAFARPSRSTPSPSRTHPSLMDDLPDALFSHAFLVQVVPEPHYGRASLSLPLPQLGRTLIYPVLSTPLSEPSPPSPFFASNMICPHGALPVPFSPIFQIEA